MGKKCSAYGSHARFCSWNQTVLHNEGKVSCSRKQREPWTGFKHTTYRLQVRSVTHYGMPPLLKLVDKRHASFYSSQNDKRYTSIKDRYNTVYGCIVNKPNTVVYTYRVMYTRVFERYVKQTKYTLPHTMFRNVCVLLLLFSACFVCAITCFI